MLGVPGEDADHLVELSNYLVEGTGDSPVDSRRTPSATPPSCDCCRSTRQASHALFEYAERLGGLLSQVDHPEDDPGQARLVAAVDDGERLSPNEYRNLFHLLIFAGNETTRTALTHGAMALSRSPPSSGPGVVDELPPFRWRWPGEEILRWATPVLHMQRTAAVDTTLAGTQTSQPDRRW